MGKKKSIKKQPTQERKPSASPPKPQPTAAKKKSKPAGKTSGKPTRAVYKPAADSKTPNNVKKQKRPVAKTQLTAQDLDHFRKLLIDKLHEILGDVNWIENEALHKSRQDAAGDLSTMPIHMADLGTDNYEQEFSLGLMDSERKIVQDILDALKRIALGTYGICEGTGQTIPRARLEANPWARYCVEYASQMEQGKVIENRYSGSLSFGDEEEDNEDPEQEAEEEDSFVEEESEEEKGGDELLMDEDPDEEDDEIV